MYTEVFEWFRTNVPNAFLAYLQVPLEVRLERDRETKGVYKLQSAAPQYSEPNAPDLVVNNYGETTPDVAAEKIVDAYLASGSQRAADKGKASYWNGTYAATTGVLEPSPFAVHAGQTLRGKARSILEVGCGNGRDAAYFASLGFDVTATDTSEAAIDLCKRLHATSGIRFVANAISALAPAAGSYDAVYSRFVLHAMTAAEEAEFLSFAYRVLRPQGLLLVECRSINDPLARKGEVLSPTERIHGHYRRFIVLDELTESLRALGYRLTDVIERKGLAVFRDEDPMVIRVTCTKA
jgi:SAM-dependent methyltransferase